MPTAGSCGSELPYPGTVQDAPFPGAADSDSDTGSGDSMPEGRAGIGGFSGTAAGSSEDGDGGERSGGDLLPVSPTPLPLPLSLDQSQCYQLSAPTPTHADDSEAEQEAFIDPAAVKSAIEAARLQLGLPALGTEGEERAAALKKLLKVKSGEFPVRSGTFLPFSLHLHLRLAPSLLASDACGMGLLAAGVRNTRVVAIQRPVAVEEGRRELPIIGYEQEVMEAVGSSDVVMLSGETGCGKTTQVRTTGNGVWVPMGFGGLSIPHHMRQTGSQTDRQAGIY